jgi:hypothetical protein
MRTLALSILSAITGALILLGQPASAADVFVLEAIQENTSARWGTATTSLVRDAVTSHGEHRLSRNESTADYVLQPKLLGLGEGYILTIEKKRGDKVVLAKQVRVSSLDDLDKAAARATNEALASPFPVSSAVTTEVQPEDLNPLETSSSLNEWDRGASPVYDYWTAGIGPFGGNNLDTENILYSIALGHTWDIHPRVAIRALGESAFSTGDEDARLFNVAVGPSYYFMGGNPQNNTKSPYANLDFGYGFGQANNDADINGFSLGLGVGYRFFRTATTGMEVNVRWATLFDPAVGEDNPQIIGARLGVDF